MMGYFGGVILRSGRRGFAVYRDGKVVAQYTAIGRRLRFGGWIFGGFVLYLPMVADI